MLEYTEPLLTPEEVCQFLRITDVTLRRLIADGKLESYILNKRYKISRDQLDRFLKNIEVQPDLASILARAIEDLLPMATDLRYAGLRTQIEQIIAEMHAIKTLAKEEQE